MEKDQHLSIGPTLFAITIKYKISFVTVTAVLCQIINRSSTTKIRKNKKILKGQI